MNGGGQGWIPRVLGLVRTQTARQTFTLFFGSSVSKGIAFAVVFALAHFIGREAYDGFGLVLTLMLLIHEFTELGMNNSLIRHAAEHVEAGRADKAAGLFRFTVTVKAVLWSSALLAGFLAPGAIAEAALGGRQNAGLVWLGIVGGIGLGAVTLLNGAFYSHKQFGKDVLVSLTQNLTKLGAVAVLGVLGRLTLESTVWVYAFVPWAAAALGLFLLPARFRRVGVLDRADLASMARFGLIYALTLLLISVENRLGVFLLKKLHPAGNAVADFLPAQQLMIVFYFLLAAYSNVMISRSSSVTEWAEVVRVQRKSLPLLGLLAAGIALLVPLVGVFLPLLLPTGYHRTVPTAQWLLVSVILGLLAIPSSILIFHLKRLWVYLVGHLVGLPLLVGLCFLWIPEHGAPGLAAAFTVGTGAFYLVCIAYGAWLLRRGPPDSASATARASSALE